MKKSLFKQNKLKTVPKLILTVLALLSTFSAFPTNVEARSLKDIFLALTTSQDTQNSDQNKFPVADDREPARKIWVIATAYSSEPAQTDDTPCIPANGLDLCKYYEETGSADTIAANFLPFETQIKLPDLFENKIFIVRDRMNAKYNYEKIGYYRIDLWMPSREEAVKFGVKKIQMEVYGKSGINWKLASK